MRIAEIFTSIQGEGTMSGYPTVFVRLSGCNLRCAYCDTTGAREGAGLDMMPSLVASKVFQAGIPQVCITGGEPLLQHDDLLSLLPMLCDADLMVGIETNGTIDFRPFQKFATICMDVKCPSSGENSDLSLLSFIREEDSVKYVIGTGEDMVYAHRVMKMSPVKGVVFWSPVFGSDPDPLVAYILKNKLPVRFQVQLHKIIGVQ
jgi:7-carboxy-7-deazaguanine synthase